MPCEVTLCDIFEYARNTNHKIASGYFPTNHIPFGAEEATFLLIRGCVYTYVFSRTMPSICNQINNLELFLSLRVFLSVTNLRSHAIGTVSHLNFPNMNPSQNLK